MSSTGWVREGVQVAEFYQHWSNARATIATVERLTATQIILDNGNRYRRDNGKGVGDRREELLPVDDYRVRNCIAAGVLSSLRHRVDEACKDHNGSVAAVLATLDEIARLVAEARAKVEG